MALGFDPDKEILKLTAASSPLSTDMRQRTLCEMDTIFYNSRVFDHIDNSSFWKTEWYRAPGEAEAAGP